jgi:hypothetical protein
MESRGMWYHSIFSLVGAIGPWSSVMNNEFIRKTITLLNRKVYLKCCKNLQNVQLLNGSYPALNQQKVELPPESPCSLVVEGLINNFYDDKLLQMKNMIHKKNIFIN